MKGKTMTKKYIKTSINFGGFYESIHDGNIDHMVEAYEYNFDDRNVSLSEAPLELDHNSHYDYQCRRSHRLYPII